MKHPFYMAFVGTEGGGGAPAGSPAEPAAPTDPAPAARTEPASGAKGGDPASTEPTQADLLKSLGVGSVEDLQGIIEAHNKAEEANHTDLENAKANLDKLTGKLSAADARAVNAEAQLAAFKQGVVEEHVDDALALARVALADKANPAKTIDVALQSVLERNPAFKGDNQPGTNPDGTQAVSGNVAGNSAASKNDVRKQVEELNKFRII
ncbi:hypothetical protein [Lacticaseibacillus suilingensis]|uniref:hypothetical protein n=1 Tax=Lacticaseibacillus suilingensis TaxID=2799577 RepID=UPI0022E1CF24|nr:hypothetical protein [Lacticaseibacillus suilingensis]